MLEVVLDTETTGLSVKEGHRIVEIGCLELENQIPTQKFFHKIINPKRLVSEDAYKVHGYSDNFLSTKKEFFEIAEEFLEFINGKKLIIHNAQFDLSFLNLELKLIKKKQILSDKVVDTLEIAKSKFPGSSVSLDALCKRFRIDNSKRIKHSAIMDCELLAKVYINLIGQKEPTLKFNSDNENEETNDVNSEKEYFKKIIYPSQNEINSHNSFLKNIMKKNNY